MASAWGDSWGSSWGVSWGGGVAPVPPTPASQSTGSGGGASVILGKRRRNDADDAQDEGLKEVREEQKVKDAEKTRAKRRRSLAVTAMALMLFDD